MAAIDNIGTYQSADSRYGTDDEVYHIQTTGVKDIGGIEIAEYR